MNESLARRATAHVEFDGVDITSDISPYLLSLTYTDNEESSSDDLSISLMDTDDVWLCDWLPQLVEAADSTSSDSSSSEFAVGDTVQFLGGPHYIASTDTSPNGNPKAGPARITIINEGAAHPYHIIHTDSQSRVYGWVNESELQAISTELPTSDKKLKIRASIETQYWDGEEESKELDCGEFEMDSPSASGPPSTITLKATALPVSSKIRQTKKSKAWESYKLSGIAKEMASNNGLECSYLPKSDPQYERVEQTRTTDISFLSKLCKNAGFSLKATDKTLVIFDQSEYEQKDPILTIEKPKTMGSDGVYEKYKCGWESAETEYESCRVSYTSPSTGQVIEGIAKVEDYDEDSNSNQQLEIYAAVSSSSEAKALAEKMLRLYNKAQRTISLTMPGNLSLVSGVTVQFAESWGLWAGKYLINQAKHTISSSGYTVQIKCRKVLGGY